MNQIRSAAWIVLCVDEGAVALAQLELLELGEHPAVLVKRAWSTQTDGSAVQPQPHQAALLRESEASKPIVEHPAVIALRTRRRDLREHALSSECPPERKAS